jgi:hypothetical protein
LKDNEYENVRESHLRKALFEFWVRRINNESRYA